MGLWGANCKGEARIRERAGIGRAWQEPTNRLNREGGRQRAGARCALARRGSGSVRDLDGPGGSPPRACRGGRMVVPDGPLAS